MGVVNELKLDIMAGNETKYETVANNLKKKAEQLGLKYQYKINLGGIYEDEKGRQRIPTIMRYELPKMGEYELIAILEIYEGKPLVKLISNKYAQHVRDNIKNLDAYCDHCKQKRNRRYLYLLWDNKSKRVLQLGKSCSRTYVGHGNVDRLYKFIWDLTDVKEEQFFGRGDSFYVDANIFSLLVFKQIEDNYDNKEYIEYKDRHDILVTAVNGYYAILRKEETIQSLCLDTVKGRLREALSIINKKGNELGTKEYNLKLLLEGKFVRSDKLKDLSSYYIKLVNDYINGYGFGVSNYEAISVVNATFNYLNTNSEDTGKVLVNKIKEILDEQTKVKLDSQLSETRTKWLNKIRDYTTEKEEDIARYLSNNEVSGYNIKDIIVNIEIFLGIKGSHVGNIGERLNLDVRLDNYKYFTVPSYSGYGEDLKFVYTFKDKEDNVFTWFTMKDSEEVLNSIGVSEDEDYTQKEFTVSAKIKDHTEFNDQPQTILNYLKIVG